MSGMSTEREPLELKLAAMVVVVVLVNSELPKMWRSFSMRGNIFRHLKSDSVANPCIGNLPTI